MTLTDRQAFNLEMEFLQQDLGRVPSEMPITTFKRELTRALYERATADEGVCPRPLIPAAHSAIEDTVAAVVRCLDKVVTAWEQKKVISAHIVDGVRTAATIITEAAERAGMAMPAQPAPGHPAGEVIEDEADVSALMAAAQASLDGHRAAHEVTADGQPAADWTPSDGGLTPSMIEGI